MDNELLKQMINSFHEWEIKDFDSICGLIDKNKEYNDVAVVSNDSYLLSLIFTALIRHRDIKIHLLNPAEGKEEIQRLLYGIMPNFVVFTEVEMAESIRGFKKVLVNGLEISNYHSDEGELHIEVIPGELEFSVISYSPYPSKICSVSCGMFRTMLHAIIQDLEKFHLVSYMDHGLIPFLGHNSDYLLYHIAVKIAACGSCRTLPTGDDIKLITTDRKFYLSHNRSDTLYIPKKEFLDLWDNNISPMFENRFIFRGHIDRRWLVNILIKWKLKKLFKGFKNVLIIGMLDNAYMIYILNNLSFVKFYSVFPIRNALMYGPISNSLESVVLSINEYRQDAPQKLMDSSTFKGKPICLMNFRLFHPDNEINYV
ncbi:MAG: hypothetical protein IMZ64_07575, partial [Bacteroidetes bacterium]|nr:hypothetical protein [Bacteroidota bacterium]